jgi:hypothetical protein
MRKIAIAALAISGLCLALTGCLGSSGGKAQAARSSLSAVAKDPHVIAAEHRARATVIDPCLKTSKTVHALVACFKTKVPKDKRVALGKCLIQAKLNGASVHDLETTAGAQCVAAALPPLTTPSTSPAAVKSGSNGI